MGTRWNALCLNHSPALDIEIIDDGHEVKELSRAAYILRTDEHLGELHPGCDLVLRGISGSPVAYACQGGPTCKHMDVRRFDIETLRLVHVALTIHSPGLADAVATWIVHNRCWSSTRLAKLFP